MARSSVRIFCTMSDMYDSTLFSRASSDWKGTSSTPTHDTMPRARGRLPGSGVSVSRVRRSIAWKHLLMWRITRTGLLPLDKMSRRSLRDTK